MARYDFQLNVRVPHELVDWLKKQAAKNRRSLTAELNQILDD
jgi:predicted HicB family RNase H-like nuclease